MPYGNIAQYESKNIYGRDIFLFNIFLTLAEWIVRRAMRRWTAQRQVQFGRAEPAC